MKSLSSTLPLTVAIGGLVAGLVIVLPFEQRSNAAWLIGALVAAAVGGITLVLKTKLGTGLTGTAAVRAVLTAQVLSFLLRLMAVGLGAFAVKQRELEPMMFVVSFFLVSFAQQILETRSLLAARKPVTS